MRASNAVKIPHSTVVGSFRLDNYTTIEPTRGGTNGLLIPGYSRFEATTTSDSNRNINLIVVIPEVRRWRRPCAPREASSGSMHLACRRPTVRPLSRRQSTGRTADDGTTAT